MAERWAADAKPLRLVLGMQRTKDVGGFLAPLLRFLSGITAVEIPEAPASFTADGLKEAVLEASRGSPVIVETATDVAQAISAITVASPGSVRILICGSLYLAGSVLAQQGAH